MYLLSLWTIPEDITVGEDMSRHKGKNNYIKKKHIYTESISSSLTLCLNE